MNPNFNIIDSGNGLVKAWTKGVSFEEGAKQQLRNAANMPFIHKWIAAMPDVHVGKGATIGSVIPTVGAIIPAAVGVDLGCGMMAVKTTLTASDLPDNLKGIRSAIERVVPHGRTNGGRPGDRGAWGNLPRDVVDIWNRELKEGFKALTEKHKTLKRGNDINHLGTLGTGNHFIEVCLDEADAVWFMLHSGSRGVGARIGGHYIELAKKEMERWFVKLPDKDLAYLPEGSRYFDDYVNAVEWAQHYAMLNRQIMMQNVIQAITESDILPPFEAMVEAVNCHHNYVAREHHFGKNVWLTRKGAVRAREGDMGIIPGSMGTRSFIVRGLGSKDSFCSCSHGAGRVMSRTEARKRVSLEEHKQAVSKVECRTDADVIDETPAAYKSIDSVMEAQKDLVEIKHTLRQVVCVKG